MASKLGGLLTAAKKRLADASSTASLDAQLLMAHVIEADRAHVIAHPERELTEEQAARFEALVARRAAGVSTHRGAAGAGLLDGQKHAHAAGNRSSIHPHGRTRFLVASPG